VYTNGRGNQIAPEEAAELAAVKADPTVRSPLAATAAEAEAALATWRADLPAKSEEHEPAENC
jgi:hypothetical protein